MLLKSILTLLSFFMLFPMMLFSIELEHHFQIKNISEKNIKNDTLLNPDNIMLFNYAYINRSTMDADFKLFLFDNLSFTLYDTAYVELKKYEEAENNFQDPFYTPAEEKKKEFKNILKQAYLSLSINERVFFDIGKKVEKNGISFYKNPSDFFVHKGDVNSFSSEEEQIALLKGVILAKTEIFVTDKLFASFAYSPEYEKIDNDLEQYQGRISFQMNSSDLDFIVYYNEYFKYGTNLSFNVTDNLVLHLEGALLEEKEKHCLDYNTFPYTTQQETIKYQGELIGGGHYTFTKAGDLYFEYFFNQAGYNKTEWNELIANLDQNQDTEILLNRANLYLINQTIHQNPGLTAMRKHYLMLHYNNDDLIGKLGLEVNGVIGLDQAGGLINAAPSYSIIDDLDLIFNITYFKGNKKSEFELIYYRYSLGFEIKYQF